MAVTGKAVAGRTGYLLLVLVRSFGEGCVEELHHWNIEPIEPEHRLVGFVGMIMPGHRRCDDEVAGLHRGLLAVNSGKCAFALQDEAQRRLAVPMRHRRGSPSARRQTRTWSLWTGRAGPGFPIPAPAARLPWR